MKFFFRILCAWRGHNYWNTSTNWVCDDCERQLSYEDMVQPPIKRRLCDWIQARKDWFKCSECGRRFGRHNDTPHIPF